jgi:hypothetical protein
MLVIPAAHAQLLKYNNEAELFGAAAVSPDAGRQVLQKLVDLCATYSPEVQTFGRQELKNWADRHRTYLEENVLVRQQFREISNSPSATPEQQQGIRNMLEVMVPETVVKQFEAMSTPIRTIGIPAAQISLCKEYIQAIADGKFDLRKNDPSLSAYLDQRIARREAAAAAQDALVADGKLAPPTEADIGKFYDEHPELFSARRIYSYRALSIKAAPDVIAEVQKMVDRKMTIESIATWAKNRNLQIAAEEGTRPAERMPMKVLPAISTMKDGQIILIPVAEGGQLLQLQGSESQPLDLATATPSIRSFLMNPKSADLMKK